MADWNGMGKESEKYPFESKLSISIATRIEQFALSLSEKEEHQRSFSSSTSIISLFRCIEISRKAR